MSAAFAAYVFVLSALSVAVAWRSEHREAVARDTLQATMKSESC
jgi:hypothetical protein